VSDFVYSRTVTITRPGQQDGEGALGYGGQTQASETIVIEDVRASIQERREGQKNGSGLPGDGARPTYYVFMPDPAPDQCQNLDIITDDLGCRYQVTAPYWDSMGHRPTAELLKA
jgi:hypothetical protein